jgi:5-methyltetrahydropteroyltriglutamate--homocysteine methyltransferase
MLTITVVSHYPKVGESFEEQLLRRSLSQFDRKEIDFAQLERIKDEVTRTVIEEQIEAGVEVVTDGQIRWDDPVTYLARKINGFTLKGLLRYFDTNTFYRQPVCESELSATDSLVVKDFQFANAMSSVPVKTLLTGPYTLAKLSQDRQYENLEEFASRLAALFTEEVKRLVRSGATLIQFDEPAILNFKKEFPLFKKIWTKFAASFPDGLETVLFLNFGHLQGIYPQILEIPVTTLGLDYAGAAENRKVLKRSAFTKKLVAGIVDARNTKMETEEELRGRLEELLQIVSAEDLSVSPNYGLEFLPRETARKKLAHLAKVVREFREAKVKV